MSAHSRETWLFEIPVMPMALTNSSTERVDTPWIYASCTTAARAFSAVRRGSKNAGKYEPRRSLGMRRSTDPTRVSQSRSR
jgi:hypothetical protein